MLPPRALSLLLALALLASAHAETPATESAPAAGPVGAPTPASGTVLSVRVIGLKRVEEAALLDAILLREGEGLADWKVQRDLRAVWRTGFVDAAEVRLAPQDGGVAVEFVVREKPAVREVRIMGAKKVKEDDLKELITIEPFTVPSESRVAQNVRAIKDKYLEKGFYLATITPVVKPVGDDLVEIVFEIVENKKVIVQRVDITGNTGVPDRKIRRFMQTKQGGVLPWLTSAGTFVEEKIENDVYVVRQVLMEEGYVDADVSEPKVYLSPDKRYIFVDVHVDEGPRYQIGKVAIVGDFVAEEGLTEGAARALVDGKALRDVQGAFRRDQVAGVPISDAWFPRVARRAFDFSNTAVPLRAGDWFKLSNLQATAQRINDLYGDQGYAFVNVVPNPESDPEREIVDLTFYIQKGEKIRIGQINITGNDPTYDKVVRREIPINEGEIYRGSALREARERLERLGFFESVDIATPKGEGDDVVDMNVDVKERPTGSFSVGAGYGSAQSFLFTASVSKSNFLGLGYLMSVSANISARSQQANISFFDPHFLDSQWTMRVDGYYNQQAYQYIERQYQRGGSLEIGRYLDKRDDVRLAMDYTFEDVGLLSLDEYKERLYGGKMFRNGLASQLGLSLSIDKRNNRISATRGFLASVSTQLAGGFRVNETTVVSLFGGEFNFWETKANFRFYQPLVPKGDWLVFRFNTSIGHIQSTDGSIVPYIHRYRAGGITSVRGYEPYSLGPTVRITGSKDYTQPRTSTFGSDDPSAADDKLVIGGTETWVNNFELESPIVKAANISAVAFFDAGNTFGDPWGNGTINPLELRFAAGFGIRWFSPIGPLRFEWGFPIGAYADERKSVFDFTIGSAF